VSVQRTVQPTIEQRIDGAQNSLNAIGTALKLDNDNSLWQNSQEEPDEIGRLIYIEKSEQAQDIILNATNSTRVQSPQLPSPAQLSSQTDLERQVKRCDLLPLTSAAGQQLSERSSTRPVNNNGMEIGATYGAGTSMFPRSVKVLEQQMNGGHNPVAVELQEPGRNLQLTTVASHNTDQPTTRRSNLTA
jgi:hypothetical protein